MHRMRILNIFIFLSLLVSSSKAYSLIEVKDLDKTQRVQLSKVYRDFLVNMEKTESVEKSKLYSTIIFEKIINNFLVYADGLSECVYAGWPSRRGSHGFCERPEHSTEYKNFEKLSSTLLDEDALPSGFEVCSENERRCNPVIFGPVCAPFDTRYNRVRATSNCDKTSRDSFPNGFDYKSYLEENVKGSEQLISELDSNMMNLQRSAEVVCTDSKNKQSKTAVCRILSERLKVEFPFHSSKSQSPTNSLKKSKLPDVTKIEVKSKEDLETLENEINSLTIEIEKTLGSDSCTDPSVAKIVNERYNTIQLIDPKSGEFLSDEGSACIQKLKPLLVKRAMLLENYERGLNSLTGAAGSCHEVSEADKANSLQDQITDINTIVAKNACEKNPTKWTAKGCASDFACSIGSSFFFGGGVMDKIGASVGKKLGIKEDCLSSQNNCVAKIVTAAADVIWSFLRSIPELASMAWDGIKNVGKKIYNWMPWVTETEQKLSDANQAAMNVLEKDEPSTLEKIGNFFTSMWDMLKEYVTDDLMCTEPGWETERFKKDAHCDQPFVSFKCMTCAGAISSICNVIGAVGSEFVIGLLTGGGATAVKAGARAISLGVKAGARMALKSQMKGLAGAALRTTAKVGIKAVQILKAPLTLGSSAVGKSKVFIQNQKYKFAKVQSWVSRNANKISTPIRPKSRIVKNIAELSGEYAKKAATKIGKISKNIVTAPFKLPGKILKVGGRILDPFKLGERGFALGYNAAHGLIPMSKFVRISNYGHDLSNAVDAVNKASSASRAVDATASLLSTTKKQMSDWIKAAKSGKLTQEEFNQLQQVLKLKNYVKTKYASNANAIKRLDNASVEFEKSLEDLLKVMGSDDVNRYIAYSSDFYKEASVKKATLLKKDSKDIVLVGDASKEKILILDHIDGNLIGVTGSGKKVVVSTGNLSKSETSFIVNKLSEKSSKLKLNDVENLSNKKTISKRIKANNSAQNIKPKTILEKANTRLKEAVAPQKVILDRRALNTQINKTAKIDDATVQRKIQKQVNTVAENLLRKTIKPIKQKELVKVAGDLKLLDEVKHISSAETKVLIDAHKREIFLSIEDKAVRSKLANEIKGRASNGKFSKSQDNISLYNKRGRGDEVFEKSFEAKVTSTVDDSGAYIKLETDNSIDGIKLVDESSDSFVGFNLKGQKIHIKKTSLSKESVNNISERLSVISPNAKQKMFSKASKSKMNKVYPTNDPDFIYAKSLAKNEIRVGDEIVKLRRFEAGSSKIKDSLVDGGDVLLKDKKGNSIQILNVHEQGKYWVGFSKSSGERVIVPKFLMDSKTNNLMARGQNFTKIKRDLKKKLSFIKSFDKNTKMIDVDKAFRSKYKYLNYNIKYRLGELSISERSSNTLEQISENVYLRAINETDAEVVVLESEKITKEEEVIMDEALKAAVESEEDFNFDELDESDFDF